MRTSIFLLLLLLGVNTFAQPENQSGKLTLLKSEGKYTSDDVKIKFNYQSKLNKNLRQLHKKYNLDSVAGRGTDAAKAIRLMRWVHENIKHNGSKGIPSKRNADSMLVACHKNDKTMNCRGMAIALNEIYLASGLKSRYVTCMPKDSTDNDCHVINAVFLKDEKKWVWMDPTFEAYVMDETGNLLGIPEVRKRLINDKPLILNPDANWNRRSSQSKERYLYKYMAKNLYRIECPVSSEYNYETHEKGKRRAFYQLIPAAYKSYANVDTESNHGMRGSFDITYTGNETDFWAEP